MADPRIDAVAADPAVSDASTGRTADAKDFDKVRAGQAQDTGSGGAGREATPRNVDDASQGVFQDPEEDRIKAATPG